MAKELEKQREELDKFAEKVANLLDLEPRIRHLSKRFNQLEREYHTHLCFQIIILRELLCFATFQMNSTEREDFLKNCILREFRRVIKNSGGETSKKTVEAIGKYLGSFIKEWNEFMSIMEMEAMYDGREPKA